MIVSTLKAARPVPRRAANPQALLATPSTHVRLKVPNLCTARWYNSTTNLQDYPREGVFQPNSPSRQPVKQHGAAAQPNTYFPQDQQFPEQSTAPPPPPSRRFRVIPWAFGTLVAVASGIYGFVYMTTVGLSYGPMPSPPGSPEDHEELQILAQEYDALPLVQELRNETRFDLSTNTRVSSWKEWVAYKAFSDPTSPIASAERRANMLSTGPLRGSQGLAAQSVFWNEHEKTAVVFINFGEAMCGWPGIVHGGAIATVMDETLGRVAGRCAKKSIVTASLKVDYLDKVEPGQWYVLFAQLTDLEQYGAVNASAQPNAQAQRPPTSFASEPDQPADTVATDAAAPQPPLGLQVELKNSDRKKYIEGMLLCVSEFGPSKVDILEPRVDDAGNPSAHLHATGQALYVVPKNADQVRPEAEEF